MLKKLLNLHACLLSKSFEPACLLSRFFLQMVDDEPGVAVVEAVIEGGLQDEEDV